MIKIEEIREFVSHTVETSENVYTRHSSQCWTIVMGESEEPVYDCEELEKAYQEFISNKIRKEVIMDLESILNALPRFIKVNKVEYKLIISTNLVIHEKWSVLYAPNTFCPDVPEYESINDDLRIAAYHMLQWCKKNKYVK